MTNQPVEVAVGRRGARWSNHAHVHMQYVQKGPATAPHLVNNLLKNLSIA